MSQSRRQAAEKFGGSGVILGPVFTSMRRLELPDAPYFPFRARYTLFSPQSQEHQIFVHLEPGTQTTPPPRGRFAALIHKISGIEDLCLTSLTEKKPSGRQLERLRGLV